MLKLINQLIPHSLKSYLFKSNYRLLSGFRKATQKWNFEDPIRAHSIQNAKLLVSRNDLLSLLPQGGVAAELGVNKGDFSAEILKVNRPVKLHLVDAWHSKRYNTSIEKIVRDKFANEIKTGSVEINKGLSTDVLKDFPDHCFDWVYIDTDHTYPTTAAELILCKQKVKKGGVIAGHDFIFGDLDSGMKNGVIEAVYEFCNTYNWEIIYLTMELSIPPSFAIREIL